VRSRGSVTLILAAFLLAALTPRAFAQAEAGTGGNADAPAIVTDAQMQAAIDKVKADPNLAEVRKIKTLRQVDDKEKAKERPPWLKRIASWIGDLFSVLVGSGRFIFWAVLAALLGLLLVYLWRLVRGMGLPERSARLEAPSFVRDLDIRPESLPDDIGASARRLWDGGEHRAALALLYRGLLSRLVHVHRVPIKDSSTEGDCVALASRHLADEERKLYVASLVRVWQRAVYGGETLPTETVHTLCDQFSRALDAPAASASASGPQAAGAPA
jgi:hypothetical protein